VHDRLSPEQIGQLLAAYKTGITPRELAEQYHLSMSSVARLLRRSGVFRRRTKALLASNQRALAGSWTRCQPIVQPAGRAARHGGPQRALDKTEHC
jgi:hypothetical protein